MNDTYTHIDTFNRQHTYTSNKNICFITFFFVWFMAKKRSSFNICRLRLHNSYFFLILYSLPILRSLLLVVVVARCRCCLVQQNFKNCSVVFRQGPEVSSVNMDVYVFCHIIAHAHGM